MLLLTILAIVTAETLAISSVTPKSSSTLKQSTLIKSSAPNKISSIKVISISTTKPSKSPISPTLPVSPARKKNPNRRISAPVSSSLSLNRKRFVLPAAQMNVVFHNSLNRRKSPDNKPLVVSIVSALQHPLKPFNYNVPEDLKNLPLTNSKFASISTTKPSKSPISTPVNSSLSVNRKRNVTPAAQKVTVVHNSLNRRKSPEDKPLVVSNEAAPKHPSQNLPFDYDEPEDLKGLPFTNIQSKKPGVKPSNKILSEIKQKLQQGNDDYLDKSNGRRRANVEVTRLKITSTKRYETAKSVKDINNNENYTSSVNITETNNTKSDIDSYELKFLNSNRYLRRSGVTTPSQYEIKPYRKHRGQKKKKYDDHSRREKHHRHGQKIRDRHVKRRHQVGLKTLNNVVTDALAIPIESGEPNLPQMVQPITVPTTTTESTATRPAEYEVTTSGTTTILTLPFFKATESKATSPAFRADLNTHDKEDVKSHADKSPGRSLTTLSAFEIKSEKKQKKLERFVKFINKNRVLLREFIAKKKNQRAGRAGKGIFRSGRDHEKLHANQLDMSPGKGNKIEELRAKGRLCQRNLMIPEGPKYNSMGCTYMPEFKKVEGRPDYPSTKPKRFLIPACCNCCKKSVLGCE